MKPDDPAPTPKPSPRPAARSSGIADQLRRAIADSGLSAEALARASGLPDARPLQRFVAGTRDLHLATAAKVASALNLRLVEQAAPRAARRR